MPLINGKPIRFVAAPSDIPPTDKVFQIRFTGEIFKTYQEYSARLDYYRQPKFSCKYTGKSGFSYELAIDHENKIKQEIYTQIPQQYLPLILKEIQYSQLKISELTNKIYEKCINEYKIKNNIKDQPEPQKITAFLQPAQSESTTNNINNTNTNTNNEPSNTDKEKQQNDGKKKKTKKPSFKHPFKKHLIRTQIRVAADQQNFKNAPWILHHDIANKYDIKTEMPQSLKTIIDEYIKKQQEKNKPKPKKERKKKEKKEKKKKEKKEKPKKEETPKPKSLIDSFCIKSEENKTKSLKYPCDDQLLLMYDKMDNDKLIAYDTFWNKIQKIGFNQIQNDEQENEDENKNNYSNLAFSDYNTIYDHNDNAEDMDIDIAADSNRNALKHRQLNDLFNEIWKLWSFIECYHSELDITPFPISFLMDSLCYDKRAILLDELQVSLLECIRKHCITTITERYEQKKEHELKKLKARKKQQKANQRKAERARQRKARQARKSDKEEADDDDEEEEDESEDEEMSESEYESESEEEESSEDEEDTDLDSDDIDLDIEEPRWDENSLFTDEPIGFFKLDLLRDYLRFRCSPKVDNENKQNDEMDEAENMDIDEKDDEVEEEEDVDMNTEEIMDEEEPELLLPEYEYTLSEEIWDKLNNIRSYVTLPIESKLEILKILFQDAMSTNVISDIIAERIEKYPDFKQKSKELDDEYNAMVKEEKLKLREVRSQLVIMKRVLNPKKSKKTKAKKADNMDVDDKPTATSASSSNSVASSVSITQSQAQSASNSSVSGSGLGSKSNSNSPDKENNGSRATSKSSSKEALKETQAAPRITSRQQIMLAKKEQKAREQREREEELQREKEQRQQQAAKRKEEQEKEQLKAEIIAMSNNVKNATNLMNQRIKLKQEEITKKKYELGLECRTYLVELGSDRFNNKYFWSNYSDGRIFVYHSNPIYHNKQNKENDCLITKGILKMSVNDDGIKCGNEWEMITTDNNQFCWSFVSTTTQFYQLLNILDSRGLRESELLLMLNSLKSDIVTSMKMIGNDDHKALESDKDKMDLDGSETSSTTDDVNTLRRSTRAKRSTRATRSNNNNNKYRIINIEPPYKKFANKGFLAYKNMVNRK